MTTAALKAAKVGDRVRFYDERMPYTIQARNDRFVILTKPFAARQTVLYSIVDFDRDVRGPDDMIFGGGYETREQCEFRLRDLTAAECPMEVSHRRYVPLMVFDVRGPKPVRISKEGK